METINLSEKQQEIVFADNGPIYVKASAGSGKTRVLTERIRHILTKTKKKILALTFTNKAGEEIRTRLVETADIKSRLFIGTFHGFCQYVLENHGSSIGLSKMPHIFENDSDRLELIVQAINQTPSYAQQYSEKNTKEQNSYRYNALDFISKVKRELISDDEFMEHTDNEDMILLYQNYQDILRSQNAIDFDDLLLLTYKLFINYPQIASLYRRSFHTICIDEAQDLNNAQYKLLLALTNNAEHKNVMMVGDPNQSIFHFTGSSSDYMDKEFVKDFTPKVFELSENYRSSKAVLDAANKILPKSKNTSIMALKGKFKLKPCEDENEEAQCVIKRINKLIEKQSEDDIEGKITYETMVILARNKYVFNPLEKALKEANIPFNYKMTPGAVKFESKLMKIFDLAFRIRINPQDILHKERLDNLVNPDSEIIDKDVKQMLDITTNLKDDGSNLKKLFETFRDNITLVDEDEKSMLYHDIDELIKHWLNYAKSTDKKSLHQFKNAMALGQTHTLTQHKGITLSTVHTMKGQEFDIVFLIGMDHETFPDYRAVQKGGVDLKQEKNNLYVAFTRAKRFLYATYPLQRTMPWGGVKRRRISEFLKVFDD
ncbi:MAG: ATP-dependent helicase [Campylobacterota bacterium]|nr:ATP-dependent helicase [Campylobacterota bacterium]